MSIHDGSSNFSTAERLNCLRLECASVASSMDSRLSSLTQSLSVGVAVVAALLISGTRYPPLLAFLSIALALPVTYALLVWGDVAGLMSYRKRLEVEVNTLVGGKPVLRYQSKIIELRATNPALHWLTRAYASLYISLSTVGISAPIFLHLGLVWIAVGIASTLGGTAMVSRAVVNSRNAAADADASLDLPENYP